MRRLTIGDSEAGDQPASGQATKTHALLRWPLRLNEPSVLSARQACALMLLAFLLVWMRAPKLLIEGHVVAEEGTTYLRYAWNATPLEAFLAPHQGYFSLFDNLLALVAARVLPLAFAALFFTWSALAIQLVAAYLVISCTLARSFASRLVALLAYVFASASLGVWLSMENMQFYLPVCVALILITKDQEVGRAKMLLLLLAGLTGVTSCMLVPLFWAKAIYLQTRKAAQQAALLTAATITQGLVLFHSLQSGYRVHSSARVLYMGPVLLQRVFLLPFSTNRGVTASNRFFALHASQSLLVAAWLLLGVFVAGLTRLVSRGSMLIVALMIAALVSASMNWFGCSQCDDRLWARSALLGTRYFFVANTLLSLSLAYCAFLSDTALVRRTSSALLALALFSGGVQFWRSRSFLIDYQPWRPQVKAWKQNPQLPLREAPAFWEETVMLPAAHANRHLPAGVYDSSSQASVRDREE